MMMINYNCGADLSIDSSIRLKEIGDKAPEMGTLSLSTHKVLSPNSVCLAVEQSAFFWGFVISAVLRRHNSAKVGVTDRVKAIQHLQGMLHYQPRGAGRESNKGHICSFMGLCRRAVADSD